jgi:hypothetical protein
MVLLLCFALNRDIAVAMLQIFVCQWTRTLLGDPSLARRASSFASYSYLQISITFAAMRLCVPCDCTYQVTVSTHRQHAPLYAHSTSAARPRPQLDQICPPDRIEP